MNSSYPQHLIWRTLLAGLLFVLAFHFPFSRACGKDKQSKSPKQDEACLACHGQAGMKSEKGKDISIRPEKHAASVHGILACSDCHTQIKEFPHPAKIRRV